MVTVLSSALQWSVSKLLLPEMAGNSKQRRTKENKGIEMDVLKDYLRKHRWTVFLGGINLFTKHPCVKRQWKGKSLLDQCQFFVAPLLEVQKINCLYKLSQFFLNQHFFLYTIFFSSQPDCKLRSRMRH